MSSLAAGMEVDRNDPASVESASLKPSLSVITTAVDTYKRLQESGRELELQAPDAKKKTKKSKADQDIINQSIEEEDIAKITNIRKKAVVVKKLFTSLIHDHAIDQCRQDLLATVKGVEGKVFDASAAVLLS